MLLPSSEIDAAMHSLNIGDEVTFLLSVCTYLTVLQRRLTGMRPKKRGYSWVYSKSADVLRAARLRTVGEYIARRRQTVLRAIADRPILEECREAER